jgi:amino acid adenylation domain-containing protein
MNRQNVEDLYPLTPLQQGMLFHTAYSPQSGAYVEQLSMEMRGVMRIEPFARAWRKVMERHPALRTAFVWEKVPKPLQVVFRAAELPVEEHDWRALDPAERAGRMAEFLEDDRVRAFDLTKAPLLRISVFLTDERECLGVITTHHMLFDGWSFGIVAGEVMDLYNAEVAGRSVTLARPRPFREYLGWLAKQDTTAAEAFWRRALAGFRAATPLALDRPAAPGAVAEEYGYAKTILGADVTRGVHALARGHGLTVNTLFQGAWALLLSRHAGTDDVVFGCTVSGRPADLPGVQDIVGLFINTLPQRVRVEPELPILDWLHDVQAEHAEARQHEHAPLVDVQGWSEVPRGRPLFESLLVFENYPVPPDDPEAALEIVEGSSPERTHYPLVAVAVPGEDEIRLRITYDRRRFSQAAAERVLAHLATLVREAVRDPRRTVGEWALADAAEAERVRQWSGAGADYPRDATLPALFAAQAARTPDAPAVVFGGETLTYAELDARATRLARGLRSLGAGPGAHVALPAERSAELVVSIVGIAKAGAAYVPLDTANPPARLAFLLDDAAPVALVVPDEVPEALADFRGPVVSLRELSADADSDDRDLGDVGLAATDPACLVYTSGSTGRPKAVLSTHRAIVRVAVAGGVPGVEAPKAVLQFAPLTFDVGSWEVWTALVNGGRVEVMAPGVPAIEELGSFVRARGIDTLWLTAGVFTRVAETHPRLFSAVRQVLTGGDVVPVPAARRALAANPELVLVDCYGPTETGIFATTHRVTEDDLTRASIPVGSTLPNTRVHVIDTNLNPVAVGVPGEVYVGGDAVSAGYWRRAAMTAECFVPDPFSERPGARMYRTGDRGRWLAEGALEFLGRGDWQVKVRGFRVEPDEVAAALRELPGVRDACVAARTDAAGETVLAAYVVAADPEAADAEALRAALRARVPDYMVPAAWVFVDALPLGPTGKVDRRALPALDESSRAAVAAHVPPRTETEVALAEVWKMVLGAARVGASDDFFALGGHSLRATSVVTAVRERMEVEIPIRAVFETPVLADLAARIDAEREARMAAALAELEALSDDEARARLEAAPATA